MTLDTESGFDNDDGNDNDVEYNNNNIANSLVEEDDNDKSICPRPTLQDAQLVGKRTTPGDIRLRAYSSSVQSGLHRLHSIEDGKSQVELIVSNIEKRQAARVFVDFTSRKLWLKKFRKIAIARGYADPRVVLVRDVVEVRNEYQSKIDATEGFWKFVERCVNVVGRKTTNQHMVTVSDHAIRGLEWYGAGESDKFYFEDFFAHNTTHEQEFLLFRNKAVNALLSILLFYVITPILFCWIAKDERTCPKDPTDRHRWYYGWLTSLYFASTTMSTVGYGDISLVSEDSARWQVLLAVVYMIAAIMIMSIAFAEAMNGAATPVAKFHRKFSGCTKKVLQPLQLQGEKDEFLYMITRRMWWSNIFEIVFQFLVLNLIGVFVSRFFVGGNEVDGGRWTWSRSLYWSIQTTTTIGYGDSHIPFEMYWFLIFYLILGTYFVGNTIGRLRRLKDTVEDHHIFHAWDRQQLSPYLIKGIKPLWKEGEQQSVDQFEFVLASLVELGKVSSKDINPIMNKFRNLAQTDNSGDPGLIEYMGD